MPSSARAEAEWSSGYPLPANLQFGAEADAFSTELVRLTQGRLAVKQFPSSTLSGEPVTFQGKYNDVPGVALNVQPLQKDGPPIHVAIQRREAAYYVGRQGRSIFSLPYSCLTSAEEIRGLIEDYRKGYRESGAPGRGSAVLAFHCHVAETDAQAKVNAEEAFNLYLDTRLFYDTRRTYDTVVDAGLGMFGSPATVANQLVALHQMGIDHVMFLQNFGVLDSKLVQDSMRRIANEVMPEVSRRIGIRVGAG
ncbi:MAG: LLM class flavin-dependent oxidoreductase [Burkholderiaceae bacterium]